MRPRGITLVEVVLFGAIGIVVLAVAMSLLSKPLRLQEKTHADDRLHQAERSLDILVKDIKESDPASFQITSVAGQPALLLAKQHLNLADKTYDKPVVILYRYEPAGAGEGRLIRDEADQHRAFLDAIEPPTELAPLFEVDAATQVVTINIRYLGAGKPAARLVRRVTLAS